MALLIPQPFPPCSFPPFPGPGRGAPGGLPASLLARLKNEAVRRGVTHQNLLGAYARERFLFRLGASPRGKGFVLKGAMLFALEGCDLKQGLRSP